MSKTPLEWLRERRRLASTVAVAVLLSAPVALAIAHEGYPISDVDLSARNVWVTNSSVKMAGRLNVQIEELTGGVQTAAAAGLDVLQDGDDIFVVDDAASTVTRIESTVTEFGAGVSIPPASTVSFGGGILAVVSPAGGVYAVDARGDLEFDPASEPVVELAAGAKAVTSTAGVIFAAAPGDSTITRVDPFEGGPQARAEVSLRDFDITVIGDHGVVLDRDANAVIFDDGRVVLLGASQGLRLQQAGPEADSVVVATTTGLVEVGLDGSLNELGPRVDVAATAREYVAAPVVIGACVHGAWAQAGSYVGVCDGREAVAQQIPGMAPSAHPVFRVNRSSFALNDLVGGAAWLIDEEIIQVDNWDDVAPQDETETEGEDDSTTQQTFENQDPTLNAHNEPPVALDDSFGVRPGKVTILDVLGNDSDSDGDVLVITKTSDVPESRGVLDVVDDGRALQFHPAEGSTAGTFNFRYTVSDGRGGTSEARVEVAFHANDENAPPAAHRVSGVAVEQGQSITYNVLNDWRDPDGDDLTLIGASVDTGDLVRFTSDGFVTFTSLSAERTVKTVSFTVSDGREQSDGVLSVQVVPSGSLAPVAIPDFVSTFVGRSAELEPLGNDLSPAGSRLSLVTVDVIDAELVAEVDPDRGVVVFSAGQAGSYYASYVVSGGSSQASTGLIRVDVADDPSADLPPIAVKDTAYVRPKEPTLVPVLANDASPSGRVIGIQSVEPVDPASGITVEVLASTRLRVTAPSALSEPVEIGYTISDGVATSTSSVTVIPVPELTKHQAPIANDDAVKVRVGDIVSVPVLANDLHPDGVAVALDTALVQANIGVDGLAFVTEDSLRLQAPTEPGTYSVTYRIFDKYEESAVADVTVTVIGADAQNNKPPLPSTLVSRVFQGSTVTVEVPLDGIDPDGDSVVLTSASGPNKGTIISSDSHSFVYRAGAASTGTDTFSYELRDTFGAVATGEVRIGILERPETLLPPTAVPDAIVLKPGRLAEFSPSANDSDPNGLPISFGGIVESPESTLTPEVTDDLVTVTAPATPGTYTFRYLIENSEGASSEGLVTVEVDEDASVLPPVAVDHVIETADIIGLESIDVSVLDGATNPGGRLSELEIEFDGPNVANATVIDGDTVRVVLTSESQAIAYRLVNARDGVSGMAFIVVPRFTDAAPPALKPEFSEPVELALNETRQWSVSDLVDVPSGRDVRIIYPDKANAGGSVEGEIVVDESTLQFDPIEGFRGDTSLTFTVTRSATSRR